MAALNKDPESWARVVPAAVVTGSTAQARNVLEMALQDIARLSRQLTDARAARNNLTEHLRKKDLAMGELFRRLDKAGVDYSDLIP